MDCKDDKQDHVTMVDMLNFEQSASWLLTTTMRPLLLPNTLLLFFCLSRAIPIIKYMPRLVFALVLSAKSTKNSILRRKTIMVVILLNTLLMIFSPWFVKSLLDSLIMLSKLPNLLTTLSLTLSILKLSEMHWRRLVFGLQQRRKSPCLSRQISRNSSILLIIMKIGLLRTGRGYCGLIKLRLLRFGQMRRCMCGNNNENHCQTILLYPQSSMEEVAILWYGAVWAGINLGSSQRCKKR